MRISVAAAHVINGFGKSAGPSRSTSSALWKPYCSNEHFVGVASEALVSYMLEQNADIGRETGTVNPVVFECNDGFLNDIRSFSIRGSTFWRQSSQLRLILKRARRGGQGMSCYQLKGGIGSASRVIAFEGCSYTLGVLVLTNYGLMGQLRIEGRLVGPEIFQIAPPPDEDGSVIVIIATDMPLTERQLGRLARRAPVGLTRTGRLSAERGDCPRLHHRQQSKTPRTGPHCKFLRTQRKLH